MGTKYSSQSATGYNASPPADDGSQVASNEILWSTIKTKLPDPIKDFADNMNSALLTHFDESVVNKAISFTTTVDEHKRTINVTAAATISLGDATTMGAGYIVTVKNSHSAAITVDLATGGDVLDGTAAGSTSIPVDESITFVTNASANGYFMQASFQVTPAAPPSPSPIGSIIMWPTATAPANHLECDNTSRSMTTYESLYDVIANDYGLGAGTAFTAAASDTITSSAHGLVDDDVIEVTTDSADLPAGLSIDTKYFVISSATNTFEVSTTQGGAAVNISDAGTGIHSFHNEFKTPDLRGQFVRGFDNTAGTDPDAAGRTDRGDGTTGDNVGTKQADELKSHTHTLNRETGVEVGSNQGYIAFAQDGETGETGGNETRPTNVALMYIIKYAD